MLRAPQRLLVSAKRRDSVPIDATTIDYWDAEVGIGLVGGDVDTWTGQKAGLVIPYAIARPRYVSDSSFANGHAVQSSVSASRALRLITSPMLAAGSRPYIIAAARFVAQPPASSTCGLFDVGVVGVADNLYIFSGGAGPNIGGTLNAGNPNVTGPTPNTNAHIIEVWPDGSNLNFRVDGALYQSASTGSVNNASTTISIGAAASGNYHFSDVNHVFYMLCSAKPSDAYITQLKAWLVRNKGLARNPPLPASAVEYWHSELQCTPSVWTGQLRGNKITPQAGIPLVEPDSSYFSGRPVFKTKKSPVATVSTGATPLAPPLAPSGSNPWMFVVGRFLDLTSLTSGGAVMCSFGQISPNGPGLSVGYTDAQGAAAFTSFGNLPNAAGSNTLPHIWKAWPDGTALHFTVDSTDVTMPAAGPTAVTLDVLTLGMAWNFASYATDAAIALVLLCSSKPTAAEEAALTTWAKAYWGVP